MTQEEQDAINALIEDAHEEIRWERALQADAYAQAHRQAFAELRAKVEFAEMRRREWRRRVLYGLMWAAMLTAAFWWLWWPE